MVYDPTRYIANDELISARLNSHLDGIEAAQSRADSAYAVAQSAVGTTAVDMMNWGNSLSSFATGSEVPGSTVSDDTLLTRALSYSAAQTIKPWIVLDSLRLQTFTQTGRVPFRGLKIGGMSPAGHFWQNPESGAGEGVTCRVRLNVGTGTASWFAGAVQTFSVNFANIGFDSSNQNSQLLHFPLAAGGAYCWGFHNLSFQGFKYVIGNPAAPAALTLCTMTGEWNVTTAYGRQFDLVGSDNAFWVSSRPNIGPGGGGTVNGAGEYLMHLGTAKTTYGPIYITADDHWRAMLLDGNMQFQHDNTFLGVTIEGRNTTDFSDGTLIRINGGGWQFYGGSCNYGMGALTGPFAADRGQIQITGGEVGIHGMTVDFATGVTKTSMPMVFASGGEVSCRQFKRGTKSGTWGANRPIVRQAAAGIILDTDYTVTPVTGA